MTAATRADLVALLRAAIAASWVVYDLTDAEDATDRRVRRVLAADVADPETGEVLAERGKELTDALRQRLLRAGVAQVRVRMTTSAYARDVMIRDPRTVRRWLAGDSPIPQSVADLLTRGAR